MFARKRWNGGDARCAGPNVCAEALRKHHERLCALVGEGQAKQYLGKAFTVDQIDVLGDAEIVKLYASYEARLEAAITKTLWSAALQLYAGCDIYVFPNRKSASA